MATQPPPPPPPPPTPPGGNVINITACDNELIILAYYDSAIREGSYELCRILNGYGHSLNVTLNLIAGDNFSGTVNLDGVKTEIGTLPQPKTISLPSDTYHIVILGINWGGAQQFTTTVNGDPYNLPYSASGPAGLVYNPSPIAITV
jgi:hypothetical protein